MSRLNRNIRFSFTGGEASPLTLGRSDLEKYYTFMEIAENFIITQFGPMESRPGTRFVAEVKDSTKKVRLTAFNFTTVQGYILEFGDLYMRVYRDGGQVQSGGGPFELATPFTEAQLDDLEFSQSTNSLEVTHPNLDPRRITRTADDKWFIETIKFSPPATVDASQNINTKLGLAANSGNGIKFRDKDGKFLVTDVGREIKEGGSGTGIAVITARDNVNQVEVDITSTFAATITSEVTTLSSATTTVDFSAAHGLVVDDYIVLDSGPQAGEIRRVVSVVDTDTVTIDVAFSVNQSAGTAWKKSIPLAVGSWTIEGAPNTGITPTGVGPLRGTINLNLDADGWRDPEDIGKFVFINDGIVKITARNSTLQAKAQVLRVLSSKLKAEGGEWTMEEEAWTAANGFPRSISAFEGRKVYGGTSKFPNIVWASAKGLPDDFGAGTFADEAFSFDLSTPFVDTIQWILPLNRLFVGTFGAEHVVNNGQNDPVAPDNVVARSESNVGSPHIQPARINNAILFINFHQNKLFLLGFDLQSDSFLASDLFLLSEHLGAEDKILTRVTFQKQDRPIAWAVRSDGILIGVTLLPTQNVIAPVRHKLGGKFGNTAWGVVEDVAIINHWTEPRDSVWMVVKRTINGVTKRYIEHHDVSLETDSALTTTGSGITSVGGLNHLEGESVWVIGDGVPQAKRTVSAGSVTVNPAANSVEVGLEWFPKVELPPIQFPGADALTGLIRRVVKTVIKLKSTAEAKINGVLTKPGTPASPFTGDVELERLGYDKVGRIKIERDKPLHMIILEVAAEVVMDDDRR